MALILRISRTLTLSAVLVLVLLVNRAAALQAHGYIGLHVHQIAHAFFIFSMIFFAVKIRHSQLIKKKSWQFITWGAWLLASWNLWAFSGHVLELYIPEDSITVLPPASTPSVLLKSWKELLYYMLKMDHLLSIPAALCFYLGLRTMAQESEDTTKT